MIHQDKIEKQKKEFLKIQHINFENLPCNLTKFSRKLATICQKWQKLAKKMQGLKIFKRPDEMECDETRQELEFEHPSFHRNLR